ncbi:MAG: penicillin-binding protein 1B [Acidiferrobacterales bacterium]
MTSTSLRQRLRERLTTDNIRRALWFVLLMFAAYILYLNHVVRTEFERKSWAIPARVYARPLELFPGEKLTRAQLFEELKFLDYRLASTTLGPGSYSRHGNNVDLVTRPFTFWNGPTPATALSLHFADGKLAALQDLATGAPVNLARLNPVLIGRIYPADRSDRQLITLSEAPPDLVNGLISVEDRSFYTNYGIDPRGMARALWTMLRGGGVQGGSTLTQQLVKNLFLGPQRTLTRKFSEVIMALLLNLHYTKQQILEAYLNEVYLGQEGNHAIRGFGEASKFYFDEPLSQIDLAQSALLVALVRGPSYYDPRLHPRHALARRNLVLKELLQQRHITPAQYALATREPLGIAVAPPLSASPYPAFLDLVRRQLLRDYPANELHSAGLRVITTLDPEVEVAAEHALTTRLARLETEQHLPADSLEGAVVVTNSQTGEVQAIVGGRDPQFEGFDRALDAFRPVGSLIKPAIYLTALEQPGSYTLATLLEDTPLTVKESRGVIWAPRNYDRRFHGLVPLPTALANSYNVATVRLGLSLGLPAVMNTIHELGIRHALPEYQASLLGADSLTPIEVAQMYQTLANGGFRVPLRAVRDVLDAGGHPLQRFSLKVTQVVPPGPVYLLTYALQGVVNHGTAAGLAQYISPDLHAAGKTGTTQDLRDSWFAGFTGDHVAVVWVGRDDDKPTGLTGATGAMTVWGKTMAQIDPEPLNPPRPTDVDMAWVDPATGLRADSGCRGAVRIPFIRGSAPVQSAPCVSHSPIRVLKTWFQRLFGHHSGI